MQQRLNTLYQVRGPDNRALVQFGAHQLPGCTDYDLRRMLDLLTHLASGGHGKEDLYNMRDVFVHHATAGTFDELRAAW